MSQFEPFNPSKHSPVNLPGGRKATEYLVSEESPEGKAWNIPQIWFDTKTGEAKFFKGDKAWDAANEYEKRTGNKFPRYDNISKAVNAAKKRSADGGASNKSIMNGGVR